MSMTSSNGSTRILLLGSLVFSGVILAGSFYLLFSDSGDRESLYDAMDKADDDPPPERFLGSGVPGRQRGSDADADSDDPLDPDGDGVIGDDPREPFGAVMEMNAERLAASIDRWLEEPGTSGEMRTIIDKLQQKGEAIPPELVARIVKQLLVGEEWEKDVILALGMLTDPVSGLTLSDLATNPAYDERVRGAALEALALSGQDAGLASIVALAESADISDRLLRRAAAALGKMGGAEASRTLVALMVRHQGDSVQDSIVTALARSSGADLDLAQIVREARAQGNVDLTRAVIGVGMRQGANAGPQMRSEIRLIMDDAGALMSVEDDEQRRRLRGMAVTTAVRMGMLEEVLGFVEEDTDGLGSVAAHALRAARGDEAAEKIGSAVERARNRRQKRELVAALGETKSFKATERLVALLDHEAVNIRQQAAIGLRKIADPSAAKAILEHLTKKKDEVHAVRLELIDALGRSRAHVALRKLEDWRDSKKSHWEQLRPWIRRAINRIETGNPDTTGMSSEARESRPR